MVANNTINFPSHQPSNAKVEEKSIAPTLTPETLQKFDVSGPRYTSYPTADIDLLKHLLKSLISKP